MRARSATLLNGADRAQDPMLLIKSLTLVSVLSGFSACLFAAASDTSFNDLRIHGDYAGAELILRQKLNDPSVDSESRISMLNNLGDLLREEARSSEARSCFEQALATSGISWDQRYGAILGLADIDREERLWDSSYKGWNEALSIAVSHKDTARESFALRGVGEMWLDRGQSSRAEPLLKRSLALVEKDPRVPRFHIATAMDSLASLYMAENRNAMAEDLWIRELQLDRDAFGDNHPKTAIVLGHLAEVSSVAGDFSRARDYSRQALSIMQSRFPYRSPAVGAALVNEAVVEARANKLDTSAGLFQKALDIFRSFGAPGDTLQSVAAMYATVLSQLHRGREAKRVVAEVAAFNAK